MPGWIWLRPSDQRNSHFHNNECIWYCRLQWKFRFKSGYLRIHLSISWKLDHSNKVHKRSYMVLLACVANFSSWSAYDKSKFILLQLGWSCYDWTIHSSTNHFSIDLRWRKCFNLDILLQWYKHWKGFKVFKDGNLKRQRRSQCLVAHWRNKHWKSWNSTLYFLCWCLAAQSELWTVPISIEDHG